MSASTGWNFHFSLANNLPGDNEEYDVQYTVSFIRQEGS